MIKLSDILSPDRVFLDLPSLDKPALLMELAKRLHGVGEIKDEEAIAQRLIKREEMISTGVRPGYAFPHAFTPQVEWLSLTVAIIPDGTDYESLDGSPVQVVFLMLGPPSRQDVHLRAMARLSRITSEPEVGESLRSATSPQEVVSILTHADDALNDAQQRR